MTAEILVTAGVLSILLGAISGYALSAVYERPQTLARWHVVNRRRIRQVHLDWIIMGTVLVAIGTAVPGLSALPIVLLLTGGIGNPLLFVPGIFSATVEERPWLRWTSQLSYASLTLGLLAAGIERLL